MPKAFLAVDWGTTNLRTWVVDETGKAVRHQEFPLGVGKLKPGEAAARFQAEVRPAMGTEDLPTIMCGMIGSNLGWEVVPYLDCPADIADLNRALHRVKADGPPVWIVPGLRAQRPDGGPDVMRGEETHVFGWACEDPARLKGERLICHPGTHAKWVRMVDGRLESFVTCMTGELFELLRKHSVLQVRDAGDDEDAFEMGIKAAGDGGALASRIFTARSRVVGGDFPPEKVKSYLSGVLIGAEAASVPALLGIGAGAPVSIIGDLALCARYRKALAGRGFDVEVFDGEEAVLTGLKALIAEGEVAC
jgi:2-dehydro-3-deoxygalactonokinase